MIILTIFGTGDEADYVTVNNFRNEVEGLKYIKATESQKVQEGEWIRCEKVEPWQRYSVKATHMLPFFETINRLDDRSIQKCLREVDSMQLALCIGNDPFPEKIERNMSKRAAEMLKEDIEFMGPKRKKDIMRAQREFSIIVNRLLEKDEIVFQDEVK